MHKRRIVEHFERLAPAYDAQVGRGPLKLLRRREHDALLSLAAFDDGGARTMLDVGCGGGIAALAAKRAGLTVSAVDLCPGMVQQIRPHVDEAWVADVEQLAAGRTWDIVVCAGVLDFVADPERAFANLAAVTAPGGRLVVQAPRFGFIGLCYRIEKKWQGIDVNLFTLGFFERQARRLRLALQAHARPHSGSRVLRFSAA